MTQKNNHNYCYLLFIIKNDSDILTAIPKTEYYFLIKASDLGIAVKYPSHFK
jgi:hypothetical protein